MQTVKMEVQQASTFNFITKAQQFMINFVKLIADAMLTLKINIWSVNWPVMDSQMLTPPIQAYQFNINNVKITMHQMRISQHFCWLLWNSFSDAEDGVILTNQNSSDLLTSTTAQQKVNIFFIWKTVSITNNLVTHHLKTSCKLKEKPWV